MNQFSAFVSRFGVARLAAMVGGALGLVAIMAALMMRMGAEPKALLYSGLDLKEASEITAALDQGGVKYEAKGDGSTIMVERDQVAAARLMLAGQGLPSAGSVGYEIFDNTAALGQTDFQQNLNRQRALEGELARSIRAIRGVTSVRVQLAMPKRELFEEEAAKPTASVVLGLNRAQLAPDRVRAIQVMVAGAVPNLSPEHVTVVDDQGRMLADGSGGDGALGPAAESLRAEEEAKLRRKVQDIVEGVVGPGRARVNVTAELDLARTTVEEKKFDPDGQVVRSSQTSEENTEESQPESNGAVTAQAKIPEGQEAPAIAVAGSKSGGTSETTNYEISSTTRTEVQEPGRVKRLSVAVAVDGVTSADGKYQPRAPEDIQRIDALVKAAVGFDQARGDQVKVENVPFNRESDAVGGTAASNPLMGFDKNDIMRTVELAILGLVAALLIFFVARPMMKGGGPRPATLPMAPAGAPVGAQLAYEGAGDSLALPGPPPEADATIDIARIEGQVKASSVKKVSEFVEKHPDASVSILRNWLHEGA